MIDGKGDLVTNSSWDIIAQVRITAAKLLLFSDVLRQKILSQICPPIHTSCHWMSWSCRNIDENYFFFRSLESNLSKPFLYWTVLGKIRGNFTQKHLNFTRPIYTWLIRHCTRHVCLLRCLFECGAGAVVNNQSPVCTICHIAPPLPTSGRYFGTYKKCPPV